MIKNEVKVEILKRLRNTEEKEGVRILMAIESGSRAWGFASPNSTVGWGDERNPNISKPR